MEKLLLSDTVSELENWLRNEFSRTVFLTNPGNAGDAVIAAATAQLFNRISFRPVFGKLTSIKRGDRVLIGGGGNFIPGYSFVSSAIIRCLEKDIEKCLLLPHTIRGNEQLLARLDNRFTMMCRDKVSFDHVGRHAPHAGRLLSRDLAMELDAGALIMKTKSYRHKLNLLIDGDWRRRFVRWHRSLKRYSAQQNSGLEIYRTDRESTRAIRSDEYPDLMSHYRVRLYGAGCDQVAADLLKLIGGASRVSTDRLHVSLVAALVGTPVCILENNYGKLGAVWETLMLQRDNRRT